MEKSWKWPDFLSILFTHRDTLPVVASGTYCDIILPYCRMDARKEPQLVLQGLKKVYELNSKR